MVKYPTFRGAGVGVAWATRRDATRRDATRGHELAQLETIQAVIAGPPEHVAAQLGRYIAAGARHLVCRIAAPSLQSQREQLERITDLFPLLRRLS
jgi:alkanesulfonate monooxygenase SsuD/methylene tetrahydromethanopterin reductase-like flavin-dependent oxidoreductase (luciferase family)